MTDEDVMLISDVARELNRSHVTVWRHIRDKRLPAKRVGPIYLVERADFEAFRDKHRPVGRPKRRPT
jgi:excisionase family DNA binding protein